MMVTFYRLDEYGEAVAEPDILVWGEWMETADRRLRVSEMEQGRVSTVFLGIDHRWGPGEPLLWETMIFAPGSPLDGEQERYTTRAEAEQGHQKWVAALRHSLPEKM